MKITQEEAYAILELPSGADEAQVKKAFRQLALRLHPDKNGGCLESAEQFKRVSAAYARLTLGHQSEDELDEDAFESFDDDFFEQLFGDSGLQFAFLMQQILGGMEGGLPRMGRRTAPRVRLHRPNAAKPTRAAAPGRAGYHMPRGNMPPGMRGFFGTNLVFESAMPYRRTGPRDEEEEDESSEWETDDEAEAGQAHAGADRGAGTSGQRAEAKTWSSAESSSEWETDHGSEDGDEGEGDTPQRQAADGAADGTAEVRQDAATAAAAAAEAAGSAHSARSHAQMAADMEAARAAVEDMFRGAALDAAVGKGKQAGAGGSRAKKAGAAKGG